MTTANFLNDDQQRVADRIFSFLLSSNQKEMSISGPAGSGKTYLLQNLVTRIMKEYSMTCEFLGLTQNILRVAFTATTNKAAEVLLGHMSGMGHEPTTIHSFMNLRIQEDFDNGIQKVIPSPKYTVHSNILIVIDEASMIDRKLHEYITTGTDNTCKIIYVGDHCQLAPVGEPISVVFSNQNIIHEKLTKIMRNSHKPDLMSLCAQLRQSVETLIFQPITPVPGVVDILSGSEFQNEINNVFPPINHDSKILAYTNTQVVDYNNYIRSLRNLPSKFTEGELLVNNSAFEYKKKTILPVEKEVYVRNISGFSNFEFDGATIEIYNVDLYTKQGSLITTVKQTLQKDYLNQLFKYYSRQKQWKNFYQLKNLFPDLRSRDSSTVYKSQGSTYTTTYIDLYNIGKTNIRQQFARMLYVSASRPTDRVIFYGNIPDKYLGS